MHWRLPWGFAKRCQATLIPLALIPLTAQQWEKGPRLEAIEQANDFLEAVKYKAARVGVLIEPYEMCTSDVVHSISRFAQEMKCEGILLFLQDATAILLPPAVVMRLLMLATSKRSVARLPPTGSPKLTLLLPTRYSGWRCRRQGHREERIPLREHSLPVDKVVHSRVERQGALFWRGRRRERCHFSTFGVQ
ncbi:MAG TPA: hypothetical protein VFB12_20695 [Ktedonobacteraceae bacterium]|nr:hypothetical protein [Ktedonobacteraceae bacterium]